MLKQNKMKFTKQKKEQDKKDVWPKGRTPPEKNVRLLIDLITPRPLPRN
jgi:hypothetical protein